MRIFSRSDLMVTVAVILLTLQSNSSFAGNAYDGHVQCTDKHCKIDLFLTRGFRAFSQCQVCHGIDGNGSTIAPSLLQKLQEIDHPTFVNRVTNGYKGQIGVMPPWKANPNVMNYIDNLYAYLKARSDKVIPAGGLERFDRGGSSSGSSRSTTGTPATSTNSSDRKVTPAPTLPSSPGVFGSRGNLHKSRE